MKLRVTLILLAVALLTAGNILAKSEIFTRFDGNDTFIAALPVGTISCPGGEPIPGWYGIGSPCTPGSRVHQRDGQFQYHFQTTDDRLTGTMLLTSANGNYDGWIPDLPPFGGPGSGQMWGTMRVVVNGGSADGVWEGSWTGTRTVTLTETGDYQVVITTHNVLFGTEGSVEGLKAEFNGTADPSVGGEYHGWILAPPGTSGK